MNLPYPHHSLKYDAGIYEFPSPLRGRVRVGGVKIFDKQLSVLPQSMQRQFQLFWEAFDAEVAATLAKNNLFLQSAPRVIGASAFCQKVCSQYPESIKQLFATDVMVNAQGAKYFQEKLAKECGGCDDMPTFMQTLRRFRNQEMLRIAWRDLMNWAKLNESLFELTALADIIIQFTAEKIIEWHNARYGKPMTTNGQLAAYYVIALGKLGGEELNFSSDVDLMFAYEDSGHTEGGATISNEQFYNQVTQDVIKCLSEITEDGFVFRVDIRLRPYGDSGPIVLTKKALEDYYQLQGRDWERYALVKARFVVGKNVGEDSLAAVLQAFTYRKYVDYSVIESLREVKALLDRETKRLRLQDNIKRGPGGIREVEFVVQAFQIIRGGKEPYLQENHLINALNSIRLLEGLPKNLVQELMQAYCYLRVLENRLQMLEDRQTQQLPQSKEEQEKLALVMQHESWDELYQTLEAHRRNVKKHFQFTIATPEEKRLPVEHFSLCDVIWKKSTNEEEQEELAAILKDEAEVKNFIDELKQLRKGAQLKSASKRAKNRMDALMPLLLATILKQQRPTELLSRISPIIGAIAKRSAYVVLLTENAEVLQHLIVYCSSSPWIAKRLAQFPLLMDEVLVSYKSKPGIQQKYLADELQQILLTFPEDDLEGQMEFMRQFKHSHEVRAAIYELLGLLSISEISHYLTLIAMIIVQQVYRLAVSHLINRHGRPSGESAPSQSLDFAIIAYGKFGAQELTYESDLDLVFLHGGNGTLMTDGHNPISNGEFYIRLGQRIIHLLSASTLSGVLYKIDVRLRPSGNAGMLVSQYDAYETYQLTKAWTWEHQALVRACVILGSPGLTQQFNHLRRKILARVRDNNALRQDLLEMRTKMLNHKQAAMTADIKNSPGGVIDLEFILQYAVLHWAHQYPQLAESTNNLLILECLVKEQLLSATEGEQISRAYHSFHDALHQQTLQHDSYYKSENWAQNSANILKIWEKFLGESPTHLSDASP